MASENSFKEYLINLGNNSGILWHLFPAPLPPCPPTPVPVQTQASFWACMDRKMRIHHPQLPGRSSAFLIPYPPFSFRG